MAADGVKVALEVKKPDKPGLTTWDCCTLYALRPKGIVHPRIGLHSMQHRLLTSAVSQS